MIRRFLGKQSKNKYVRPRPKLKENKSEEQYNKDIVEEKNNNIKEDNMDNKIEQVENILSQKEQPKDKKKVKVDKKEKGIYERAENNVIIITEDNKFLLND